MKTFLKVLLGLALAGAVVVGLVFWATSGLPDAADKFLTRIAASDYDGALAMTTPDFRASTDRAGLERFARANGLEGYQSASWSSRSIENNLGKLEGEITVAGGGAIPLSMELVKTDGQWLILNVNKRQAGATTTPASAPAASAETAASEPAADEPATPQAPDSEAQVELVASTLAAFAESVNSNDFTALHAIGSSAFQEQLSAEKLQEAFAGFVEQEVDLTVLEGMTPNMDDSSGINGDGVLQLSGDYDTEPSKARFNLQYVNENDEWRLIDIKVNVK